MEGESKPAAMGVQAAPKGKFRIPVDSDNKATEFWLFSFVRPHMSAFHLSWFSFFCCFVSTFAAPPLLPLIRDNLGLTGKDIGNAGIASVSGAVFARLAMGTACDLVGPAWRPRPSYCSPPRGVLLRHHRVRLVVPARALLHGLLARLLRVDAVLMSSMFSSPKVGWPMASPAAGATWGAPQLLMPLVFEAVRTIGSTDFIAWRVAFFIPGVMQTFSAIAVLAFGQDMPDGNYRKLHKSGRCTRTASATCCATRSRTTAPGSWRSPTATLRRGARRGQHRRAVLLRPLRCQPPHGRAHRRQLRDGQHHLPPGRRAHVRLALRPVRHARQAVGLWVVQTIGGILCIVLGIVDYSFGASVAVMILFSFFVQAACGLTFGIVPFVSRRSLAHLRNDRRRRQRGGQLTQWGGMFVGPRKGATAEEYYSKEWTEEERAKGYSAATERFAENSVREGGRRAASGSQSRHTVPVDGSPADV
ncbi:hypothetical protein ZWY2020_004555 [Hordeum vulgare]|nr:hypothetical protein ZWY2020_004555 [Hordeum vulgare]